MSENNQNNDNTANIDEISNTSNDEVIPAVELQNLKNIESEAQNFENQKQLSEIAKLHRECAKYRTSLNSANTEKAELEKLLQNLKADFETISKEKLNQEILYKLEMSGCLKPNLVLKDIPAECENLDDFLTDYKNNNPFLFQQQKTRHGFAFKGVKSTNYTSSQQMNNYIRSALGR